MCGLPEDSVRLIASGSTEGSLAEMKAEIYGFLIFAFDTGTLPNISAGVQFTSSKL